MRKQKHRRSGTIYSAGSPLLLIKERDSVKKKRIGIVVVISVLLILLTPVRMNLKDGGSVRYKSLVYEVTKIHQLAPEADGVKPYIDGFEVRILGMTIYRKTNETNENKVKPSSKITIPRGGKKEFEYSDDAYITEYKIYKSN